MHVKKRNKLKKSLLIFSVIFTCFAFTGILSSSKKPLFLLGYAPLIITTSSMEPQYSANSLIIIKKESMSNLKAGDVIVYKSDALGGKLAFHRITQITNEGLFTKGDKNKYEDNQLITKDKYVGKGVFYSNAFAPYFSKIRTLSGFILFLLMPILIIFIFYTAIRRLLQIKRELNMK